MSDYYARKAERSAKFAQWHGVKWTTCVACAGSGYYDNTDSPPCGACAGRGKVCDVPPTPSPTQPPLNWRDKLRQTATLRASRKRAGRT